MRYDDISIIIGIILLIPLLFLILKKLQFKVFARYQSTVSNEIIVRENIFNEKSLDFGAYPQGIDYTAPKIAQTYWYYMAEMALQKITNCPDAEILHIGLGASTTPHLIAQKNSLAKQTIIEIDPQVIEANKHFFQFDSLPNTTLIQEDFFKLLNTEKNFNNRFDVLIVDICTGQPPFISYEASSEENIKKTLLWGKPNALVIYNRWIDNEENKKDTNQLIELLKQHCNNVISKDIIDYHEFKNSIISGEIK